MFDGLGMFLAEDEALTSFVDATVRAMRLSATGCAIILVFLEGACGSSAASPGGPHIDSSKRLVSLSVADQLTLCNWLADLEGGYGHVTECEASGIPLVASESEAGCLTELSNQASSFPDCPATVGQDVTCLEWFLGHWCASSPAVLPAQCAALQNQCYPGDSPVDGGNE
jgi:hypothetical protein